MRTFVFTVAVMILAGCQYDPHYGLYTTSEPKNADIVGTYILDCYDLPQEITIESCEIFVDLHSDGTFIASNVPPVQMDDPDKSFFSSLLSGTGKWQKSTIGADPIWGVYLHSPDNRFETAFFTGTKPPYGLIFTLGDPDSGYAVMLKRKP
jgi:hypothetical protein